MLLMSVEQKDLERELSAKKYVHETSFDSRCIYVEPRKSYILNVVSKIFFLPTESSHRLKIDEEKPELHFISSYTYNEKRKMR